jgi:hypothetical protein
MKNQNRIANLIEYKLARLPKRKLGSFGKLLLSVAVKATK